MAGLLTHLGISLFLFLVLMIFKKPLLGFSIAMGQIIPDAVKFGITGIKIRTFSPGLIMKDKLFWELESLMSNYYTWVILGIFIVLLSFFLYYLRKIKKQQVKDINWNYFMFVIGVIIHLIVDVFLIETNYWV